MIVSGILENLIMEMFRFRNGGVLIKFKIVAVLFLAWLKYDRLMKGVSIQDFQHSVKEYICNSFQLKANIHFH